MASGLQFNTLSSSGAFIFSTLNQYANDHKPTHPQVYQVESLYILHTTKGGEAYVIPPTTIAVGLSDNPPKPLPIDLLVIALSEDNSQNAADTNATDTRQIWTVNSEWHSLTVKDETGHVHTYQPGDVYTDTQFLSGFTLDISKLFGIESGNPAHLRLEDQAMLRKVLYPIIFESNPQNGFNRVIGMLEKDNRDNHEALRDSIQRALASSFKLKTLLPSIAAPEDAIRAFLQEVARYISHV